MRMLFVMVMCFVCALACGAVDPGGPPPSEPVGDVQQAATNPCIQPWVHKDATCVLHRDGNYWWPVHNTGGVYETYVPQCGLRSDGTLFGKEWFLQPMGDNYDSATAEYLCEPYTSLWYIQVWPLPGQLPLIHTTYARANPAPGSGVSGTNQCATIHINSNSASYFLGRSDQLNGLPSKLGVVPFTAAQLAAKCFTINQGYSVYPQPDNSALTVQRVLSGPANSFQNPPVCTCP